MTWPIDKFEFTEKLPAILSRINDIIDEINAIQPRLLPQHGTTGQVLTKLSPADYDANWRDQTGGSGGGGTGSGPGLFEPVEEVASAPGPQSILLSAAQTRALLFINGLLARQSDYSITNSEVVLPGDLNVMVGDVLTALDYPTETSEVFEQVATADGAQVIAFPGAFTHAYVFINGLLQSPLAYTVADNGVNIPMELNVQAGDLLTAILY